MVAQGQYTPMRDWLNTHIHAKGRLQRTDKMMEDVTGSDLSVLPLVNHLEERYLNAA